jgi:transposase
MGKHRLAFIAFDSAKEKHAVAIADDGRDGEVRYLGEIDNSPDAVSKLVAKLSRQYERLHFCYEAGPTGYGLYRQLTDLGHVCDVVAPTMIPKRSGDRVKTNRRDSVTLVKLLRAGELRAIWVPDSVHEAVRDLTRAREVAMLDLKKKRQHLLSFLLRHDRNFPGRKNWTKMHERWLAKQAFNHPAQQIVLIGSKPCGQGGSFVAWLSLTTDIRVPQITDDIGARGRWAEVGHLRTFT